MIILEQTVFLLFFLICCKKKKLLNSFLFQFVTNFKHTFSIVSKLNALFYCVITRLLRFLIVLVSLFKLVCTFVLKHLNGNVIVIGLFCLGLWRLYVVVRGRLFFSCLDLLGEMDYFVRVQVGGVFSKQCTIVFVCFILFEANVDRLVFSHSLLNLLFSHIHL